MGKGLKRDIWVLAGCWATVLTASTLITWDGLVYVVCGLMGLAGVFLAGSYRAASRRADGPEGSKSGSLSFTISPMTGGCPAPAGMVEPWGKSVSSTSSRSAV